MDNRSRPQTPRAFWDNLSHIWLNPRAIRAFKRRNVRAPYRDPPALRNIAGKEIDEIRKFAMHGGPDLSDIRGCHGPDDKKPPKPISTYDENFRQHMLDHNVYPDMKHEANPRNLEMLDEMLRRPRSSLSPLNFTEEDFKIFRKKSGAAKLDAQVISSVLPIIVGRIDEIPHEEGRLFTNLADLTDGNLCKAKPDLYDGVQPQRLDERACRALLPFIAPSKDNGGLILPNFFINVKGEKSGSLVVNNQALYDGVLGARALEYAGRYVSEGHRNVDGGGYSIASTYQNESGLLELFVAYQTTGVQGGSLPTYCQTCIGSWKITISRQAFVSGVSAFRNVREWAMEQRERLVAEINTAAAKRPHCL